MDDNLNFFLNILLYWLEYKVYLIEDFYKLYSFKNIYILIYYFIKD
jgi:hypothetical protein